MPSRSESVLIADRENSSAGFLEIRQGNGSASRVPLGERHLLIGRGASAQVRLDGPLISRNHAELFRDPFGRWWVRDLNSRNGTRVNGAPIKEQVLAPEDRLEIGGFVLTLPSSASQEPSTTMTRTSVIFSEESPGLIRGLNELEPPRLHASHLNTLCRFSRELLVTDDAAGRSALLCRLIASPEFQGRWVSVLRVDKQSPDSPPQVVCDAGSGAVPYVSRSVLRAVQQRGEPVLAGNAGGAVDVEMSISSAAIPTAAIACPLRDDARALHLLYVMLPPEYGTAEWLALIGLTVAQYEQAELAWAARRRAETHAALEAELGKARQIQMCLVPGDPHVEGLELAIGFAPCRWVGGDYVDVVPMPDGRILLVIADVAGKGLPAALVASSVHTMVHASLAMGPNLRHLVAGLDKYLGETLPSGAFVTMAAVAVDVATGDVECINAGHPPPLVALPDGKVRELQSAANLPLGLGLTQIEAQRTRLQHGELLALYTDGLTELADEDREMLGIPGLSQKLEGLYRPGQTASQVAEALTQLLEDRQGDRVPSDDRTFLLARCL